MQTLPLQKKHAAVLMEYGLFVETLSNVCLLRFAPGETFIRQGMPLWQLFFVVSGKAKVCCASSNGRDLILCYYISRGMIGDVELMAGLEEAASTVVALTEFLCVGVPLEPNAARLRANLAFLNRVGEGMAQKLLQSSQSYLFDALHPAKERLSLYILENAQGGVFSGPLTNAAGSVGVSYRHLQRLLNALCGEGILRRKAHGFEIADREALLALCPGEPDAAL